MKICTVAQMRDLDRTASERYGIPELVLMENAALASVEMINRHMYIPGNHFCLVCGAGNNGGDGLAVARKLHSLGATVTVRLLASREKYRGAALTNLQITSNLQIDMTDITETKQLIAELKQCDAVIDAIFGTGLDREVGGIYREVIEQINTCGKTVFSLDIPSGVRGNNGQALGIAVRADYTCSFGLPKTGNLLYPGYEHGGKLYTSFISFPPEMIAAKNLLFSSNDPLPLPLRKADGHKGSFGKALFIAGSAGYLGAPYFAAMSYLKAGGGLSYLAAPQSVIESVGKQGKEMVFLPQAETDTSSTSSKNLSGLLEQAKKTDFAVIGPGLSLHEDTKRLVRDFIRRHDGPVLVDGDGLTALKGHTDLLSSRKGTIILTPHSGEFARISGLSAAEISADPFGVLQRFCRKWRAIIVLKGAHSLIGYPDGRVFVNLSGNAGMATAGSGDVLTGTIAAMYGLGFPVEEATRMGVFLHGYAGDLAATDKGADSMTAGDILTALSPAMKNWRANSPDLQSYRLPVAG